MRCLVVDDSATMRRIGYNDVVEAAHDPTSYNPDASMRGAGDRQAQIDEAFRSARPG